MRWEPRLERWIGLEQKFSKKKKSFQTFSVKAQVKSSLGLAGYVTSDIAVQLCCCSATAPIDNKQENEFVPVIQSLSCVQHFATPWTAARQAPLCFTVSLSLFKLMSIESVMPFNHLIFCCPLLLLTSIFPSIRDFPVSRLFTSGGQSIKASAAASVLPVNIQG